MKRYVYTIIVASVLVGTVYWYVGNKAPTAQPLETGDSRQIDNPGAQRAGLDETKSPFAVSHASEGDTSSLAVSNSTSDSPMLTATRSSNPVPGSALPSDWGAVLSDEQFNSVVALLKTDTHLFQQLIEDFRQETDPERKQRLGRLLSAVGGTEVIPLASELIFSGDSSSRELGMKILQKVQPGNAQARDMVSGILATEVQPDVLVDALSALSRPGDVDTQSRAYLSDQLAWLTTHEDVGVRSISLDILSRWSNDGRHTDTLLAGLDDQSDHVRSSAAYSLVGHEDQSPVVIERLMNVVRDSAELKTVKRATILALESMPLSSAQVTELAALEKQLNTRQR